MAQLTPEIIVFRGKNAFKKAFTDLIQVGKPFVGWGATDRAMEIDPEFTQWYLKEREKKGITARQLYVEGRGFLKSALSEFKPIPPEYAGPATTLIYGDRVAIFLWFLKPIFVFVIKSKETASAYRAHFDFLWNTRVFNFDEILHSGLLQKEIRERFFDKKMAVVRRKKSFILMTDEKGQTTVERILLLPPRGTTSGANTGVKEFDSINSHPEALKAWVTILGGVAPGRNGYSHIKNCVKFSYSDSVEKRKLNTAIFSSHSPPIPVLRPNGFGFWHSFTNLSNEWIVLFLKKELRPIKQANFPELLSVFSQIEQEKIKLSLQAITNYGDEVFNKESQSVDALCSYSEEKILPILINALNIEERGKHEQCTVFAIILKIAKKDPQTAMDIVLSARKEQTAPDFYLKELEKKIGKLLLKKR
ncbi:MAG: hypothetical protein PHD95_05260 [Candidatus ainarchaeum sp.]|nr:hypothetical protein [Candidatus ainarchaeum sp.]